MNQVVGATVQYADDLNDIIRNLIENKLLADYDEPDRSIQTVVFTGKESTHLWVLLQQGGALQDLRLEPLCRTAVLQHLFNVSRLLEDFFCSRSRQRDRGRGGRSQEAGQGFFRIFLL